METIGDAYLLVGGVPEYSRDHADRVIAMAFDMIEVCKTVISPADGQPIQVMVASVLFAYKKLIVTSDFILIRILIS